MRHKHPRTMQEAFGPYTNHHIDEDPDPAEVWTFWLAVSVAILLTVLIIGLMLC